MIREQQSSASPSSPHLWQQLFNKWFIRLMIPISNNNDDKMRSWCDWWDHDQSASIEESNSLCSSLMIIVLAQHHLLCDIIHDRYELQKKRKRKMRQTSKTESKTCWFSTFSPPLLLNTLLDTSPVLSPVLFLCRSINRSIIDPCSSLSLTSPSSLLLFPLLISSSSSFPPPPLPPSPSRSPPLAALLYIYPMIMECYEQRKEGRGKGGREGKMEGENDRSIWSIWSSPFGVDRLNNETNIMSYYETAHTQHT